MLDYLDVEIGLDQMVEIGRRQGVEIGMIVEDEAPLALLGGGLKLDADHEGDEVQQGTELQRRFLGVARQAAKGQER